MEGLGGLKYSLPAKKLTIRPCLPKSWEWMEIRIPIADQWTKIRYTHDEVKVKGSPFPFQK